MTWFWFLPIEGAQCCSADSSSRCQTACKVVFFQPSHPTPPQLDAVSQQCGTDVNSCVLNYTRSVTVVQPTECKYTGILRIILKRRKDILLFLSFLNTGIVQVRKFLPHKKQWMLDLSYIHDIDNTMYVNDLAMQKIEASTPSINSLRPSDAYMCH